MLLSHAAAQTSRILLGTSIVTLPLEAPLRVAEDAAVLSILSGGRFELGIGSGGTPSSFPPFGHDPKERPAIYARHYAQLVSALRGDVLTSDDGRLYPAAPELLDTLWQATFSAQGAAHIGASGLGLMLSQHTGTHGGFRIRPHSPTPSASSSTPTSRPFPPASGRASSAHAPSSSWKTRRRPIDSPTAASSARCPR